MRDEGRGTRDEELGECKGGCVESLLELGAGWRGTLGMGLQNEVVENRLSKLAASAGWKPIAVSSEA